mgnify:CR=1 FL=1
MYCVFHPTSAATTNCIGCRRQLCAACDHRIKGQPYCEDCIVRGVDALRRPPIVVSQANYGPPPGRKAPSPVKATLLAFIPGLGAVYNRQNLKALLHFVGVVGLGQIADATNIEFFGFGSAVFFLYSVIDANRSARAIAAGEDPAEDERRLKWLFARYKPLWGLAIVAVGAIALLASLPSLPFGLSSARVWAGMLFIAGAYMIFSYFRSLRTEEPRSFPTPPRSVVSAILPEQIGVGTAEYSEERTTSHLGDR